MKFLPLLLLSALLYSCEVSVGDNQNGDEQGSVKNGFSYGKKTVTINGLVELESNEIIPGESLMIQFFDVTNATQKDGYQHVGISIQIIDENGEILDESEDLFGNIEQQDIDLDYFKAYYGIPRSLIGHEIEVVYSLYDKYGTVSYDFSEKYIVVDKEAPSTSNISINTNLEGVNITGQLVMSHIQFEKSPANVSRDEDVYLYLNGVKGFTLVDSTLESHYTMSLIDKDGLELFVLENELKGSVVGYPYYPLYFREKFTEVDSGEYLWKISIKDDHSDKFVEASSILIIE